MNEVSLLKESYFKDEESIGEHCKPRNAVKTDVVSAEILYRFPLENLSSPSSPALTFSVLSVRTTSMT